MATRRRHQDGYVADVEPGWPAPRSSRRGVGRTAGPGHRLAGDRTPELPANIPNVGQVPDVPDGPVVESICVVDGDGIRGRDVAPLPAPFAELVRRHAAVCELTLDAALEW